MPTPARETHHRSRDDPDRVFETPLELIEALTGWPREEQCRHWETLGCKPDLLLLGHAPAHGDQLGGLRAPRGAMDTPRKERDGVATLPGKPRGKTVLEGREDSCPHLGRGAPCHGLGDPSEGHHALLGEAC